MTKTQILAHLPYSEPFLFVDELEQISEEGVNGNFTFSRDMAFYKGHFKNYPVTPGVILTECMAQIGLVCLGIYLLKDQNLEDLRIGLSNSNINFYLPVFPGEKVWVSSQKEYFRFNKLKCHVEMRNVEGKLVCRGEISGMISNYE